MAGFDNDVVYAKNVDFTGNSLVKGSAQILLNGQLLIGSATGPNGPCLNAGVLTSPSGTVTIGYSAPNITLDVTPGSVGIVTIQGDTGSVTGATVKFTGGATGLTFGGVSPTMTIGGTLNVAHGGTGDVTFTAFSVVTAGTTATGNFQNVSGVGTANMSLISNGASTLPTWQAINFTQTNIQVFGTPGTSSYTPTSGTKYVIVELVGGGGAGGGVAGSATATASAGGGGGGGYSRKAFAVASVTGQTITVAAGGTAGTAGNNPGGNGGSSSVGSLISATGGTGGTGSAAFSATTFVQALGGAGGSGSSGTINTVGQPGLGSLLIAVSGVGNFAISGAGGSSFFGAGGDPSYVNGGASLSGIAGTGYGSGGSGAAQSQINTNFAGAPGQGGVVVITEFLSI